MTYVYDQMNRLTQILDDAVPANVLAAYQYDAHSRRTLLTLNNGVTSAYTYTKDNEVLNLVHTWTGGEATYIHGFDGNGRRTNLRIGNDAFDPWLTVTPSLTLTANNLNQLTSIGGTPLGYDLNGNLLNDGTHIYTHDAVNRLVDVDGTITYTYDALGRRVSKTVNGTVTKYVYDGARVIAEYDGAGQLLRKYVYGPGLDEPVLMQTGATRYYYLFDSLGSVIGLTDSSGNLVEAYRYNMYGQPLQASTVGNPYMFTSRRFDSETGLYYYRNRYYSPQLRRFIEPDPIGFEGGMNLYAYVGDDPANAVDPIGLVREFGFGSMNAMRNFSIALSATGSVPPFPTLDIPPITAGGLSLEISTINPVTSGGGGVFGCNLEYTSDSGLHWYGYHTPNDVDSLGYLPGVSFTGNIATGHGDWTGPFEIGNGAFDIITGGYFHTPADQPEVGYFGLTFGVALGHPGFGYTRTDYNRLFPE